MATIKYQCDTCKRDIELLENSRGLNMFSSCTITEGCRGKMYKLSRNAYNFREAFREADPAGNLENFAPRKIFFKHYQSILSDKWIIKHNLNTQPVVKVFLESEDGTQIVPVGSNVFSVINKSSNELEIVFSGSFTGQAHLIARSISEDSIDTIPDTENLTQISYNNTLSFAVISRYRTPFREIYTNGPIQLDIVLQEPNEEPIFCVETLSGLEAGLSPWNDFRSILFRRRRNFNVKTKNIADFRVIKDRYESLQDIPQLTRLTIKGINLFPDTETFSEIKSKQLLLLLANSPYDKADKNLGQLIDIGEIGQKSENTSFVFVNGVLYSDPSNIEVVYPKIEKDVVVAPLPSSTPTPTVSITSSTAPTPTPTPTPTVTPTVTPTPSGVSFCWVGDTTDWSVFGSESNPYFDGTCFVYGEFGSSVSTNPIEYSGSGVSLSHGIRFELLLSGPTPNIDVDIQINANSLIGPTVVDTVELTNGVPFVYELDETSGLFDGVSSLDPASISVSYTRIDNYDVVTICNIEARSQDCAP